MFIELKIMSSLILFFAIHSIAFTQTTQNDSVPFNPRRVDIHSRHWNVNIQLGVQKRSFAGIGISKSMFLGSPHGIYGYDAYVTGVYYPKWKTNYEPVYGLKIGGNAAGNIINMGADIQLLNTKTKRDILFTPRIGIGISSFYINYGYSYSQNKFPIMGISKNTISMNLNAPFYTRDLVKKRKEF
jgi:hypothetical protein